MFTVCVGLVFRSKYLQFPIICFLQYITNINTVEVDPHSDLLHICIVKPKNTVLLRNNLTLRWRPICVPNMAGTRSDQSGTHIKIQIRTRSEPASYPGAFMSTT